MVKLKPHNQKAVSELVANYKDGKRTQIYVSGVGTGKSYVFLGLLDQYLTSERALYVIPKYSIEDNIRMYDEFEKFKNRVDFCTFNTFSSVEKTAEIIAGYDFVLIDEVHHIGSDIYGKNLLNVMNASSALFLGITATPERKIKADNVSQHFETIVEGISLFDAIRTGLMPPIEYRLGLPEKDLEQLKAEYEGNITPKISYLKSEATIKSVVKTYPRNKWICFFNSTAAIYENLPMIERVFEGYTIYILLSSYKNRQEVISAMKKDKKYVILSVNMLLEGVHVSGIEGIALFRSCTNISTFQQIIGRACSLSNKVNPVVLDCSQTSLRLMKKLMSENTRRHAGGSERKTSDIKCKEIIRIGVGDHVHYDINQLFYLISNKTERKNADMLTSAKNAFIKYKVFNGKMYGSVFELESNKPDYQKAKACCELYRTNIECFCKIMESEVTHAF